MSLRSPRSRRPSGEWADSLRQALHARRVQFEAQSEQDGRRHQAAAMIGDLVRALQSMGGIPDADLLPLKDCLMMFVDLERGRQPPWSRPTNFGGTNSENTADGEVRLWAMMARSVLADAGYGPVAGDRVIVQHLSRTGREMSEQTIKKWRLQHNDAADPRIRKVETLKSRYWGPVRCIHGNEPTECRADGEIGPCSDGRQLAERFAEWAIKTPNFRDRLFSAS